MRSETPKAVRQVGIGDAGTIRAATEVLSGKSKKKFIGRVLPFLGPAFIACVAYIDPGNFATNIQGGARFGYMLVWVIVASNLMAMLIQTLSAKLGIATGFNLAEMCRERFPQPVVWGMWVLSEVVAMADFEVSSLAASHSKLFDEAHSRSYSYCRETIAAHRPSISAASLCHSTVRSPTNQRSLSPRHLHTPSVQRCNW